VVAFQRRCGGKTAKENPLPAKQSVTPDVLVANEGTVFLFNPLTQQAKEWMDDNVQTEDWQYFGITLVVEHRFAWGLAQGMKDAGLVLE
jgi:hypothetical protein